MPEAAFALWLLSRIRGYGQRDVAAGLRYLLQAADAGHLEAVWLAGQQALQRGDDVEAAFRWLRAAEGGHGAAAAKLAGLAPEFPFPDGRVLEAATALREIDPVFSLRLELAAQFGLLRHEFLLLDPRQADAGAVLVVDVRAGYGKAKRRLIRINTPAQREILQRAGLFLHAAEKVGAGAYQNLRRRFALACRRAGVEGL